MIVILPCQTLVVSRVQEIAELVAPLDSDELHTDIVNNLWLRDKARQIGEKALEIFTGDSDELESSRN